MAIADDKNPCGVNAKKKVHFSKIIDIPKKIVKKSPSSVHTMFAVVGLVDIVFITWKILIVY